MQVGAQARGRCFAGVQDRQTGGAAVGWLQPPGEPALSIDAVAGMGQEPSVRLR